MLQNHRAAGERRSEEPDYRANTLLTAPLQAGSLPSRPMRKISTLLWLYLLTMPPAFAYVDPSSGLLLIQGLLALVGGIIAYVKRPMDKLRAGWRWLSRKRDA
jgi:hypothetical protein